MRAVVLRRHGGPEVLEEAELPMPEPGAGEVRVRVGAVALNHVDLWVRRGMPHLKLPYPFLLGADIAGDVEAIGPGVADLGSDRAAFAVGDAVVVNPGHSCGRCRDCLSGRDNLCRHFELMGEDRQGGYAEYVVVPASNVVRRPSHLSVEEAAALPVTFLTAWQMLTAKAPVHPGDDVLIVAAGSGVGTAAIQIAKLHGARVIATSSSDEKLARCRALGADEVINHASGDLVAEIRRLTGKRGVDIIFDHVGQSVWPKLLLCATRGGRIVTCGATSGYKAETDLRHVFFRQLEILGSTMAPKGDLFPILDHVGAGRLKPVVDHVLPLAEARRAHELLEARSSFGKIVLKVKES